MKITTLILSVLITGLNFAQNNTVLTINDQTYDVSEFNYIYTKNNSDATYHDDSLMVYVQKYFIDYKLKIIEAKRLGYDTLPRLKNELKQYRTQLSRPYLIDKEKNEALVKEAYERTINEVRASHILIKISADASDEDTLIAYNKLIELRNRILAGESFESVAAGPNGSEDPSVKINNGDLGFFTALQMVYPFEEAAFNTKQGEISLPIRTKFGYHIIKSTDTRKALGKIQTAHIMISSDESIAQNDAAKAKIEEIYKLLGNGEKFENLAMKYSDDQSSKSKGGALPEFGAGSRQRMLPKFEKTAFSLANDGDYSMPFKTPYGWHIVKRINVTPVQEYTKIKRELKLRVEKDIRSQTTQQAFINNLKKEYNFSINNTVLSNLENEISEDIFTGKWNGKDSISNKKAVLISFAKQENTLEDFVDYLINKQRNQRPISISSYINSKYDGWVNSLILSYEDSQLESKHPAFKNLMREYEEGVLIFEIMQQQVWNKAALDTVGLKNYYMAHKTDFTFNTRYDGQLYKCKSKSLAKSVIKMIKNGDLNNQQIKDSLNQDSKLNISIKKTIFNYDASELTLSNGKMVTVKDGKYKTFEKNGEYFVFKNDKTMLPSIRAFNEAKGLATAGYQNELQGKWIKSLRKDANIKINTEVLFKAESFK